MKKRKTACLALLLCGILLSLAGCGGKDGQKDPWKTDDKSSTEADPSETKELVISAGASKSDIHSEAEDLFRYEVEEGAIVGKCLGLQYYKGEPVQLWLIEGDAEGNPLEWKEYELEGQFYLYPTFSLEVTLQLYLFRADGTRELLIGDLLANDHHKPYHNDNVTSNGLDNYSLTSDRRNDYYDSQLYLDRDGACYCWWYDLKKGNKGGYTFMKMEPSGKVAYDVLLDDGITVGDMLQLPDGRMFLVLWDRLQNATRIAEFDPDTGKLGGTDVAVDDPQRSGKLPFNSYGSHFGTDGEGNLYLIDGYGNQGGIYRVNLSDGSVSEAISFAGTTYTAGNSVMDGSAITLGKNLSNVTDLRVLPDGSAEILWRVTADGLYFANQSLLGIRETLRPVSADRPAVTVRAESFPAWMKQQAALFNRTNPRWQVVLEEYASSNAADPEEYARLTNVQIATGKGPDMFYGSFMDSYVPGMLEKGALLELSGPLEETGIREEDYLPLTFDAWRMGDSVYGVTAESGTPLIYTIDSQVLGGAGEPDIKTLVKALQAWEEDSALLGYNSSSENLRRFLQGSEDLWGMINWEKGTCDFSGDLFKGLLEVSKRYGYDENLKKPNLLRTTQLNNIYEYISREGRTVCGTLYDDGCHGTVTGTRTLTVNAASDAKEGALEFLGFLLGEGVQKAYATGSFPVRRDLLEECVRLQAKRTEDGNEILVDVSYIDGGEIVKDKRTYTAADITEDRIREYLDALENVRAIPARNRPVIDIICEEAEYYFNGDKSFKDVLKVIKSRVGLYLEERR